MQPYKCRHPGCDTTHKSTTGYCAEHVGQHARRPVVAHEGRACSDPHLIEESLKDINYQR